MKTIVIMTINSESIYFTNKKVYEHTLSNEWMNQSIYFKFGWFVFSVPTFNCIFIKKVKQIKKVVNMILFN